MSGSLIVRSVGAESPSGESILLASPMQRQPDIVAVAYKIYATNALGLLFAGIRKDPTIWSYPHLCVIIKNDKPLGICRKPDALILNCGETSVSIKTIGGKNGGPSTSVAPWGHEGEPWVQAVWDMLGFDMAMRDPHYEPVYIHTSEEIDSFLADQQTRADSFTDEMFTAGEIGPRCHAQIKQYIGEARKLYRTMVMANRKVIGGTHRSLGAPSRKK